MRLNKKFLFLAGIALAVLGLSFGLYFLGESSSLTEKEAAAFNEVLGENYSLSQYEDLSEKILTKERKEAYPGVKKVCLTPDGDYGLIAVCQGCKGPVTIALAVSGTTEKTIGMRILEHTETEHYVRDMENSWFTERFAGKSLGRHLEVVKLEALDDNDIIAITGATVTTEGITEGVNQCLAALEEYLFEEKQKNMKETESVSVFTPEGLAGEVSLEEIREMPAVKRTMEIRSSQGTTNHEFRGTLFSNVLAAIDPALLSEYTFVEPIGVDGYLSDLSMEEVLGENNVYLMYEDKGEPLKKKNGEPGGMRVVVLDDTFGQRFTNYLVEITLE